MIDRDYSPRRVADFSKSGGFTHSYFLRNRGVDVCENCVSFLAKHKVGTWRLSCIFLHSVARCAQTFNGVQPQGVLICAAGEDIVFGDCHEKILPVIAVMLRGARAVSCPLLGVYRRPGLYQNGPHRSSLQTPKGSLISPIRGNTTRRWFNSRTISLRYGLTQTQCAEPTLRGPRSKVAKHQQSPRVADSGLPHPCGLSLMSGIG